MNSWKDFLKAQGARISSDASITFTDNALQPNATYLVELGYQGMLLAEGLDAAKFLQGQITSDVRELAKHKSILGAQCNLKGRMIGSFRLAALQNQEQILLRMHREVLPHVLLALKKYSVFSKVELTDQSDTWRRFGLFGPDAAKLILKHTQIKLETDGEYRNLQAGVVIRIAPARYELWMQASAATSLWEALAQDCNLGNSAYWRLLDIRAGLGEVRGETIELFTPQALNFQLTGAINFKKGCYTGQEVVARLHYKALLKKHMFLVQTEATNAPAPGTEISNSAGKKLGEVVMAEALESGFIEALVVLPKDDKEPLFIANSPQSLQRKSLPYAIPKADE